MPNKKIAGHFLTCGLGGLLILGLLLPALVTGCTLFQAEQGLAAPVEELDGRLVRANNSFGLNIFQALRAAEDEENLFISPASIFTALAMTYNGAEAETRQAMAKTLDLEDMTREEVNEAFADLLTILHNPDPRVEMAVANSLWAREGVDFKKDFLQRNEDFFNAEVTALDFGDPGAADIINDWVNEQTGGKIEDIVEAPIDPLTVLFLINTIYFHGEWSEPFDPELTREIPFYLADGSVKEHPVMFKNDDFSYFETDLFQAIRLPYGENERLGMYVFLPSEQAGLKEFYEELDPQKWAEWTESFTTREGEVGLPRFKFEYEKSLNDVLKALGMGIAFDYEAADFSGMREIPPRLYISEVKHKSFVEVNEEGTEAAAATSVEIRVESARPDYFSMIVDRPFFFAIADDMTGPILFMGAVLEP